MNKILTISERNNVLLTMADLIREEKEAIIKQNKKDLDGYNGDDLAMEDRLKVDDAKIDGMIASLEELASQADPLGKERFHFKHDNGMDVYNKTAPFGTIMIIYESRPDVTIEAAVLAFKANNKIYLKGGKEAKNSNIILEKCWHEALEENGLAKDWIELMHTNRTETQEFLQNPPVQLDLIVPRGGERLIQFVKDHAKCAVLVSGRGNNFLYVAEDADWEKAVKVIFNAKTDKISGCNALDKVFIDKNIPAYESKLKEYDKAFHQKIIFNTLSFRATLVLYLVSITSDKS